MLDYVIYGKIIIDEIRLNDGSVAHALLGGGGPQAAFGARLWSDSVGLLTRSGCDLAPEHEEELASLDVNLDGWHRYSDIPTPHTLMSYDENEYLTGGLYSSREDWERLLGQMVRLPESYTRPRVVHLITEFPEEPMVDTAFELRSNGTIVSLEPLVVSSSSLASRDRMIALMREVDVVTPDWPTASGFAGSSDPARVMNYWSEIGARLVAVRHGARGSYVIDREEGTAWHIPPVVLEVVDPTGAGNAYGGGLCVGWGESEDARRAGAYGAVSAAFMLGTAGIPRMADGLHETAAQLFQEALGATRRL